MRRNTSLNDLWGTEQDDNTYYVKSQAQNFKAHEYHHAGLTKIYDISQ